MRLLHLADVHLGMENYGKLHPTRGLNTRVLDFLACLDQAVAYAIDQRLDAVIFAGDAYKSREPSPTLQRELAARILRLTQAGLPVFLLVGNHDLPGMPGKANSLDIFATLEVPGVTVARQPGVYTLDTAAGPLQVAALPALPRGALLPTDERRSLGQEELADALVQQVVGLLDGLAGRVQAGSPAILAAHLSVEGATVGSEANLMAGHDLMVPVSALAHPQFAYVALGHIHKYQQLNPGLQPEVVYSGSIERVDFGEETDEKGFVVVELADGQAHHTFVPVAARRFVTIRCRVGEGDPTEQVLAAIGGHDIEGAVVRVVVEMDRDEPLDQRTIRAALAAAEYAGPVVREVHREAGSRNPHLTEQLTDPMHALEEYLKTRELPADRAGDLREYAARLIGELEREESLTYVEQ